MYVNIEQFQQYLKNNILVITENKFVVRIKKVGTIT